MNHNYVLEYSDLI